MFWGVKNGATYVTEAKRKRDGVLRWGLRELYAVRKNRARRKQDKERADLPTGAHIDVRDQGKTKTRRCIAPRILCFYDLKTNNFRPI